MTHSYMCHDSFICVPWLIHMCAMTHSYVCHDSFICDVNPCIQGWGVRVCVCICVCGGGVAGSKSPNSPYSYVWHDSFTCVPSLIHTCTMTHWYVCHDAFVCVPWLIRTCAMTHSYVTWLFLCRGGAAGSESPNGQHSIFGVPAPGFCKFVGHLHTYRKWLWKRVTNHVNVKDVCAWVTHTHAHTHESCPTFYIQSACSRFLHEYACHDSYMRVT